MSQGSLTVPTSTDTAGTPIYSQHSRGIKPASINEPVPRAFVRRDDVRAREHVRRPRNHRSRPTPARVESRSIAPSSRSEQR
ncbi:hypothetical protein BE221DRAFT_68495 [Ostreococcus tauri]|uniref:Uncharacterized protein n=1 Tax=Ostreococcus tauri TaxID=70448 RepID=A0A1Y5IGK4_OSTTA|nr:hypothetical protein BE221DRAFT_68495 [Ostreococcus tauri]